MALDPKEAVLALHRFGFGPRSASIAAIAADPRGALLADLERPNAGQIANADLPSSAAANRAVFEFNAERAANDKREKRRREAAPQVAVLNTGGYEREAIRPHVLGRFKDMLLAAESHPAMLLYLNNEQSIGPDSVAGINRDRGLNENLAREVLELHTLGVRTVYRQADVTSFAK